MDTGESWFRLGRERGPARVWRATAKTRKFAPLGYATARAATVLVTALGFFALHFLGAWLIGSALTRDVLSLEQARWLWIAGLASASFFAGHTAAVGLLDAYEQRRVRLPEPLPPVDPSARARNPWTIALQSLGVWGSTSAAISGIVSGRCWSNGVHLSQFAWQFAAASALLSGGIVLQHTGRRFLEQARLAPERRRFAGSEAAYLWRRHVLPQGVVNAVLNAGVGLAIAPVNLSSHAFVPASFIRHDALGTSLALTLIIAGAVRSYASFESRWGVAPRPARVTTTRARTARLRSALIIAVVAAAALLGVVSLPDLPVWTFIACRALGCGVLSAAVAYAVARRTIRSTALTADAS